MLKIILSEIEQTKCIFLITINFLIIFEILPNNCRRLEQFAKLLIIFEVKKEEFSISSMKTILEMISEIPKLSSF
jgi:hypothetical protein